MCAFDYWNVMLCSASDGNHYLILWSFMKFTVFFSVEIPQWIHERTLLSRYRRKISCFVFYLNIYISRRITYPWKSLKLGMPHRIFYYTEFLFLLCTILFFNLLPTPHPPKKLIKWRFCSCGKEFICGSVFANWWSIFKFFEIP